VDQIIENATADHPIYTDAFRTNDEITVPASVLFSTVLPMADYPAEDQVTVKPKNVSSLSSQFAAPIDSTVPTTYSSFVNQQQVAGGINSDLAARVDNAEAQLPSYKRGNNFAHWLPFFENRKSQLQQGQSEGLLLAEKINTAGTESTAPKEGDLTGRSFQNSVRQSQSWPSLNFNSTAMELTDRSKTYTLRDSNVPLIVRMEFISSPEYNEKATGSTKAAGDNGQNLTRVVFMAAEDNKQELTVHTRGYVDNNDQELTVSTTAVRNEVEELTDSTKAARSNGQKFTDNINSVGRYGLEQTANTKAVGKNRHFRGSTKEQNLNGSSMSVENNSQKLTGSTTAVDNNRQKLTGSFTAVENNSQKLTGSTTAVENNSQKLTGSTKSVENNRQKLTGSTMSVENNSQKLTGSTMSVENNSQKLTGSTKVGEYNDQEISRNARAPDHDQEVTYKPRPAEAPAYDPKIKGKSSTRMSSKYEISVAAQTTQQKTEITGTVRTPENYLKLAGNARSFEHPEYDDKHKDNTRTFVSPEYNSKQKDYKNAFETMKTDRSEIDNIDKIETSKTLENYHELDENNATLQISNKDLKVTGSIKTGGTSEEFMSTTSGPPDFNRLWMELHNFTLKSLNLTRLGLEDPTIFGLSSAGHQSREQPSSKVNLSLRAVDPLDHHGLQTFLYYGIPFLLLVAIISGILFVFRGRVRRLLRRNIVTPATASSLLSGSSGTEAGQRRGRVLLERKEAWRQTLTPTKSALLRTQLPDIHVV
jgi:uncharacterized protein (DUF3084 family)